MPASQALEESMVCTYSAQSKLSNGVIDDFVRDKFEKKFLRPTLYVGEVGLDGLFTERYYSFLESLESVHC